MRIRLLSAAILAAMVCSAADAQVYNSHVALPATLAGQNAGGAESAAMDRSNGFPTAGVSGSARVDSATSGTEPTGDGTSRNVGAVTAAPGTSVSRNP
jgi:hypothetical protein